jgi:hypothetical protein
MFRTRSVSIIRRAIKLTAYATSGTVTVSSGLSQDDGRPHDTVTVPDVAYAVNFIDFLMMDTERVRNM